MRAWRHHQYADAPSRSAVLKRFTRWSAAFTWPPAPEDYLREVMAELKKFDLDHVMPMHCSGQNFVDLAGKEMPEKLVLCGTGSSFTFTA
jgi:metal-dependent hydrolase (beta-lactamase superfamily II)